MNTAINDAVTYEDAKQITPDVAHELELRWQPFKPWKQ